jgi:hypothetical protein
MGRLRDLPREGERRLARLDAAAVAAHIDLDIDRQSDPDLARCLVERADLTFSGGTMPTSRRPELRPRSSSVMCQTQRTCNASGEAQHCPTLWSREAG